MRTATLEQGLSTHTTRPSFRPSARRCIGRLIQPHKSTPRNKLFGTSDLLLALLLSCGLTVHFYDALSSPFSFPFVERSNSDNNLDVVVGHVQESEATKMRLVVATVKINFSLTGFVSVSYHRSLFWLAVWR